MNKYTLLQLVSEVTGIKQIKFVGDPVRGKLSQRGIFIFTLVGFISV